VNHLAVHIPLDGRGDGDKGSANRVFLQFPIRLLALRGWRAVAGDLRKCANDHRDHLTQENSRYENDEQPKDISKHGVGGSRPDYFFFAAPFFGAGADGFLYSVEIWVSIMESIPRADSAYGPSAFKSKYF
jgi:hypothetical protein